MVDVFQDDSRSRPGFRILFRLLEIQDFSILIIGGRRQSLALSCELRIKRVTLTFIDLWYVVKNPCRREMISSAARVPIEARAEGEVCSNS